MGYKALNTYKGQNGAGTKARELLGKQGFDGVNNDDEEYIAFHPEQIKSATGNNGNYDASDPNIFHQFAGETAKTAGQMQPAKKQDERPAGNQVAEEENIPQEEAIIGAEIPEERKAILFGQIEAHIAKHIAEELTKGEPLEDVLAELVAENSSHRAGLFGKVRAILQDLESHKDDLIVKRLRLQALKHEAIDLPNDEVNEKYQKLIDDLKGVIDYGGFLYQEIGIDRRGNNGLRSRVVSWRTAEDQRDQRNRQAREERLKREQALAQPAKT